MALVPTFALYGEPHRAVASGFVHVESLRDRSQPSEWRIRPHSHGELHHVFLVTGGGGWISLDDAEHRLCAPALLAVPARRVHGFNWTQNSHGSVMTLAETFWTRVSTHHPELTPLFARARIVQLTLREADHAEELMLDLLRELSSSEPGQAAAVEASLLALFVLGLRGQEVSGTQRPPPLPGQQAALVARLRQRIEERFRLREPVASYAAALGASESALRAACARITGASPGALLDERTLTEARQALLYTNLGVAEIGHSLGFADPAYFSRFFARNTGQSPRAWRAERSRDRGVPGASDAGGVPDQGSARSTR